MAMLLIVECDHCHTKAEGEPGELPVGWYRLQGLGQVVERIGELSPRDRLPGVAGEPRPEPPTVVEVQQDAADAFFDTPDCLRAFIAEVTG